MKHMIKYDEPWYKSIFMIDQLWAYRLILIYRRTCMYLSHNKYDPFLFYFIKFADCSSFALKELLGMRIFQCWQFRKFTSYEAIYPTDPE